MTAQRLRNLRQMLKPEESMLVSNLTNIRYLCGFTGSNATLVVNHQSAQLFTDSRYEIQAAHETFGVEIIINRSTFITACASITTEYVAIESAHLSVAALAVVKSHTAAHIRDTTGLIEQLRVVKDETELIHIESACKISMEALQALLPTIRVGDTERELAIRLERLLIDYGAEDVAFDSIVAFGSNSAIPHHQPTTKPLSLGDLIKIDFGARVSGYHSDCTRTFCMGKPKRWQAEIHALTLQAQSMSREHLRAFVTLGEIDAIARNVISDGGYTDAFTHGLGHGVGLQIHEDPFFKPGSDDRIHNDTVITLEPGIYLADQGGVRIEDTVVVTEHGYRNLTQFDYDLLDLTT